MQHLISLGLTHHTAPLEVREVLALPPATLSESLRRLAQRGVRDAVILSTCNRFEVYARRVPESELLRLMSETLAIPLSSFAPWVQTWRAVDAVSHLFHVAAGLDSQVLGESEVLGQVKRAWELSREEGLSARFMNALFRAALTTGKRVRTETELGVRPISLGTLAVRQASAVRPDLTDCQIAVLGAGVMGRRILRELQSGPSLPLWWFTRDPSRLRSDTDIRAEVQPASELQARLHEIDVLFCATESASPVLDLTALDASGAPRPNHPLLIIDLGMPRNVDPGIMQHPGVTLLDLDGLQTLADEHRESRQAEVPAAARLIEADLATFVDRWRMRDVDDALRRLKERVERVRAEQLAWAAPKLVDLTDREWAIVDQITQRLTRRLMHHPLSEVRLMAERPGGLDAFVQLFGLEADGDGDTERPNG